MLHIISAPVAGGAEILVKQLAMQFERLGHSPSIGFLSRAVDDGRSLEFERDFLAELERAGVSYFVIGRSARKNPLLGAWRVYRHCIENDVQVYHSHLKYGVLFGALLRIPRLTTHHNILPDAPWWAYQVFNLLVDQYVGISDSCGEQLRRFTGRPVQVIHNGVDTSTFAPIAREFGDKPLIACISVGRIFPQKNYSLLVKAISMLRPDVRRRLSFTIVGEGPSEHVSKLNAEIAATGMREHIKLLGNRDDIPELLRRSQLFLMSSAFEGYPISLLEATASGLPFIATDVGGCREIAELCGNGIVITPDRPELFANAITALIEDPQRMTQLSKAAVRNASKVTIEETARAHLRLYDGLLAGRSRS